MMRYRIKSEYDQLQSSTFTMFTKCKVLKIEGPFKRAWPRVVSLLWSNNELKHRTSFNSSHKHWEEVGLVILWQNRISEYRQMKVNECSLRWRLNERDSVSNHQPHDCLLNRLFRRRSKKTSKLRVTGLCAGNSSGTGEFPAQMASYAENVYFWWRHASCTNKCHW